MTRRRPAQHNPFMAANVVNRATFVIGAEATNVINVGVTFRDADNNVIAQTAALHCWLSTLPTGLDVVATAPSSGIAIGTNGLLIEAVADKYGLLVCNAAGLADINFSEAGVATFYLVLRMPDGSLVVSSAITFA